MWVIDGIPYKRTRIPISQLAKGIAIVLHTHGAKYPHSWEDVNYLRKWVLDRHAIAQVVLSPEINHYFVLSPSVNLKNRQKLVDFLKLKPSQIKKQLWIVELTSRGKEVVKLINFAKKYGLEFRQGYYSHKAITELEGLLK